jgi:hypothetical protein
MGFGGDDINAYTIPTYATGTYSLDATDLEPSTTYYVQAFAENSGGLSYSTTSDVFTTAVPPVPAAEWNAADWASYDTITIDADNIDDDLTNFPVYLDLADLSAAFWSTTPSASSSVGTDIRVTTDEDIPVELARELVAASSTTQTGELHFKADSISSTTDTSFRIYYNGTTTGDYVSDDTFGAENVWIDTYLAVYHAGGAADSTSNNRTAAGIGGATAGGATGRLGVGSELSGSSQGFQTAAVSGIAGLPAFTVSTWYESDNIGNNQGIYSLDDNGVAVNNDDYTRARFDSAGFEGSGTNVLKLVVRNEAGEFQNIETATNDATTNWTLFHHRWSAGASQEALLNGAGTVNTYTAPAISGTLLSDQLTIGGGGQVEYFDGIMDEFRVASTSLSDAWIAAEYVNQSTTTNFYSLVVPITGSSTLANHDDTQVNDTFSFQNATDESLFAFKLTPETGNATVTDVSIQLSGIDDISASDFSNLRLYRDIDADAAYDATDVAVGGAGVMSISGQTGNITFTTDFLATTSQNYILVADWNAPENGAFLTLSLSTMDITITDAVGTQTIFGAVDSTQHSRNNQGGGGGSAAAIVDAVVPGDGVVSGGSAGGGGDAIDTNTGGGLIGNSPDFKRPSANSGSWSNPANAYDNTDGTYATDNTGVTNSFTNHGFGVPDGNTVEGVVVKLEVSGTTAAGTIDVQLSWDGGTSWTPAKTTPTLTTTDAVVTLGGTSNLWGRSWSPTEFSNGNFAVRLTGGPDTNTVQVDELQVRVYHITPSTGGGGGGGAI